MEWLRSITLTNIKYSFSSTCSTDATVCDGRLLDFTVVPLILLTMASFLYLPVDYCRRRINILATITDSYHGIPWINYILWCCRRVKFSDRSSRMTHQTTLIMIIHSKFTNLMNVYYSIVAFLLTFNNLLYI